jgi:hypothetical protein
MQVKVVDERDGREGKTGSRKAKADLTKGLESDGALNRCSIQNEK